MAATRKRFSMQPKTDPKKSKGNVSAIFSWVYTASLLYKCCLTLQIALWVKIEGGSPLILVRLATGSYVDDLTRAVAKEENIDLALLRRSYVCVQDGVQFAVDSQLLESNSSANPICYIKMKEGKYVSAFALFADQEWANLVL